MVALPDENRVAVSMLYMSSCSMKEISHFLGVSVNTVRASCIARASNSVAYCLSRLGETEGEIQPWDTHC